MGGMHGFGAVDVDDDAAYHEEWELLTRAICHRSWISGLINLDAFRRTMEDFPPDIYLGTSYFGRWLLGLELSLIERGYLTREEIEERLAELADGSPPAPELSHSHQASAAHRTASVAEPAAVVQRFEVGDRVRVLNVHSQRHTRVPRYLCGKVGVVQVARGHEVFPDTNAYYQGDRPQVVYSVTFEGREIWGPSAEPAQLISIDLWDSYLERA